MSYAGDRTVYDADSDPLSGDPYLAMELVEGHSLRQILDQEAPLGMSRTLDLIAQAQLGLGNLAAAAEVAGRALPTAESMQFGDGANRNMSRYDRISDLAP